MFQRVKFIYNPASGETVVADLLDEIIAAYQRRCLTIVPYRLTFRGDPAEILSDIDDTYHHILIAGGDGTVNYVVNLLKRTGLDIPIAVLPTGTANDFASVVGMPSDPMQAVRRILSGEVRPVDLGRVNDTYFVNVFSCGLFTDVSQKTPTILKNTFGKLAYYVNGVAELPKFRKMHLTLHTDGGDFEGSSFIFFVFNGKTAGNFRLAHSSEIDDGLLDVLVVKGDNPLETIQTVFHYLSLHRRRTNYPSGMAHIQCSRLTAVSATDEPTDVDGQPGPRFPLTVTCEKHAIRVIFPRTRGVRTGK